jgi:6-phosphogluconolactonase (cycloisomerase 2 family)
LRAGVLLWLAPVAAVGLLPGTVAADDLPASVYALTNAPAGNGVAVYHRAADGTLTPTGVIPTGGTGTGGGLENQGAVTLSSDGRWLFAVNAGSSEISAFAVGPQGLTLTDKVGSGGTRPVSLTAYGSWLYVLNAGETNNITGFSIRANGTLTPLPDSTRLLSAPSTGPAQVQFSPDGRLLVVTERDTDRIDAYTVNPDGQASGPLPHPSSGANPFGIAFSKNGLLLVSEAFVGHTNGSAASSYTAAPDGSLTLVTASAPTHQSSACWAVVTNDGRYGYVSNTRSGSISGYRIADDGSVSLLDADGITAAVGAGTAPIDMALSADSRYLYVLNAGSHTIASYQVEQNGRLTPIGSAGGLPPGATGLVAR